MRVGDKAGQTLGQRMSGGIGTAMRAGLGVVGAAAGIATKGLIELENVTADFRAETGATAEEAEKAGKAINEMAGRNLQPMAEIGDALAKVHTDLGQTGEAAEETAEDFLHFARVTGQDAAVEVAAFDDILDAWGLTAEDSQEIMDKLVVSHQEFGGVIAEDEAALASMAPQLRALNLDIDDGIGLLNLFKESGLDAAAIPRALNSAIQKLDGRPLEEFVAELAGIEDPTLRAERAMEIFGTRAGAQLANAIQPGITSLDEFKISTEEATGATEEARDALDGTFSNRVQLAIKGVTSKIIDFGSAFGPALTGLASLAGLGGALGLDKFAGVFAKKLLEVGKAGGEALIDGMAVAVGAIGTVIGNLTGQALDPHNPLLGKPLTRVAALAGALWARVFAAAAAATEWLTAALLRLPLAASVKGAIAVSGAQLGTALGTATGSSFVLALAAFVPGVGIILEEADRIQKGVQRTRDEVEEDVEEMQRDLGDFKVGPINLTEMLFGDNDAPAAARALAQRIIDAFEHGVTPQDFHNRMRDAVESAGIALRTGAPLIEGATEDGMVDPALETLGTLVGAAARAGSDAAQALAGGIRSGWDASQSAWESLKDAMKDPISRMKRIALLEGRLSSKRLADALESNDPLVREAAEELVLTTQEELDKLYAIGKEKGDRGGEGFAKGIISTKGEARTAARAIGSAAASVLDALNLRDEGHNAGADFAAGIRSAIQMVAGAAAALASVVAQYLEFGSPTELGPFSKGGGPEGWAQVGANDWISGWQVDPTSTLRRFAESARNALAAPLAGAVLPIGASVGAASVAGGDIGGLTVNGGIHVTVSGGANPAATGAAVRQGIADSMADILRTQTARLPTGTRA